MALLACLAVASCASLGTAPEGASTAVEPVPAAAADSEPTPASAVPATSFEPGPEPAAADVAEIDVAPQPIASASSAPESIAAAPPVGPPPMTASAEPAVAVTAVPAAKEPEGSVQPAVSAPTTTLDFSSLVTRLRKTKAISLVTKISVKSQSDDLLQGFRAYHTQHGTATLTELRRSYDSLFRTLYSLLEEADPPLARDIDRSRAAIWEILADPRKFSASNLLAGA